MTTMTEGWAMRSVGCHWTHPDYPQAVVSTYVAHNGDGTQTRGYITNVMPGLFATRELAQRAVEAMLDD